MPAALILGWEEWVALPDLGLPAIKAKVDTGARTSALHAAAIEPFGPHEAPMVRFVVHPHPKQPEIAIVCAAPVIGRRDVTSSNGDSESRYVIATEIAIGNHRWPIEVTLTNRESMSYRMLIGRQAIGADVTVEPATSFRQPKLSYRTYRKLPRPEPGVRPLRIALVTRRPDAPSTVALATAAAARGHALELLDPRGVELTFAGAWPGLARGGVPIGPFDGVIPRIGAAGRNGPALVRQLEMSGAVSLVTADALERMQHPLSVVQALAKAGLAAPPASIALSDDDPVTATEPESGIRLLLVDHKVIACVRLRHGRVGPLPGRPPSEVLRAARKASRILGLGFGSVDVTEEADRALVSGVTSAPLLTPFARHAKTDVAAAVVGAIEARVRPPSGATVAPSATVDR